MFNWFLNLSYPEMALITTIFTWFVTSLGSAVVFLFFSIIDKTSFIEQKVKKINAADIIM